MAATGGQLAQIYFPREEQNHAEIIDIVDALRQRNPEIPETAPHLVSKDGKRYELPENILEPLLLIAQSLVDGKAVSVVPLDQILTTQEAADFLGISRPTFVSLLERGEVPFEKLNRHRRVRLSDVVAYRDDHRKKVREVAKGAFPCRAR